MMFAVPFIVLTGLLLLWLMRTPRPSALAEENRDEIQALLAYYRHQSALSAQERDYRLYHELRVLRQANGQLGNATGQRAWLLWGVVWLNTLLGAGLWYGLSGAQTHQWHQLTHALEEPLKRAQYLGEPLNLTGINPLLLCQALQAQIDRTQRQQLHTLGQCYFQNQAYDHAHSLYQQLERRYPDQSAYRLYNIQSQLFKNPDRAITPALEAKLKAYIADYPEETLAPVLLAAAYERAGRNDEAKALWQNLAQTLPKDHPLAQQVQSRAFEFALQAEITIAPSLQSAYDAGTLPQKARLFLVLSRVDKPTPPLAVKILPIVATQSASLNSADLMLSQRFDPQADYQLTAFISEDGSTQGKRHTANTVTLKLQDNDLKKLEILE